MNKFEAARQTLVKLGIAAEGGDPDDLNLQEGGMPLTWFVAQLESEGWKWVGVPQR